ncbi:MAG: hypothetical protein PHX30_05885 [Candidatus Pacebacteria bacterium]|nr:hypothetical protein [Candidatus Paceibacterota bacterium]
MAKKIHKSRHQIKDFRIALKDLEPMVKELKYLHNGRDISNFSLRPREAWANWLLCVVFRELHDDDITFAEDKEGDGIIIDKLTGQQIRTEHVSALDIPKGKKLPKGEQRVIDAINLKIRKGAEYAKDKFLVVFFDGAGLFYRNKIREAVRGKHNFIAIYCIGLLDSEEDVYTYAITELSDTHSITFRIEINEDFTDWQIKQLNYYRLKADRFPSMST